MEKIDNCLSNKTTFNKPTFNEKLENQIKKNNSILCVALDPDSTKTPDSFTKDIDQKNKLEKINEKIYRFLQDIINLTHEVTCCYKLQEAFYKRYPNLMENVIKYIKDTCPGKIIIVDCKVGDIENTMNAYVDYYFNKLEVDAITVNPYMGQDVLQPFINDPKKTGIVVVQSSNPGATEIQETTVLGNQHSSLPLWNKIFEYVITHNTHKNLIAVVSGNLNKEAYQEIREKAGNDFFVLVPGVGAQGADPEYFIPYLKNNKNDGIIVVVGRGILYPYKKEDPDWKKKVAECAVLFQEKFNDIRHK
jgi:orotidine-5'-phosphate decarboxylase